ncbi:MAG: SEC-C metal-binding domain-containing protein [Thermoproteota archaeon]
MRENYWELLNEIKHKKDREIIAKIEVLDKTATMLDTSDELSFIPAISKAGRNDPCPCGSGLKFKKCCLPL